MAKKSSGCVTVIVIFTAICGITAWIGSSIDNSPSTYSPSASNSSSTPSSDSSDTAEKSVINAIPYNEQIISCDQGNCGKNQITREACSTSVCCQIGSRYTVVSSQSSCTSQQQAYIKSTTPTQPTYSSPTPKTTCCKVCTKGKACGDSCISRSYTCHKSAGCACNG